jgi:hypothetical protein
MEEYEATFEIESRTDAYAVEKALSRLYDTVREESRTVRGGTADSTELLEQFAALRDAAQEPMPGRLTVTFERSEESFEQ